MKSWLQDASDAGAHCVIGCYAERIVGRGRAAGVEATVTREDGSGHAPHGQGAHGGGRVRGGRVAGAAPALRDRRPGGRQEPPPASGVRRHGHLRRADRGLVGADPVARLGRVRGRSRTATASWSRRQDRPRPVRRVLPLGRRRRHKELMHMLRWHAPFITVARDHGAGEVTIDDLGRAVVRWGLDDEMDARLAVRAHVELALLHRAAGAQEIFTSHRAPCAGATGRTSTPSWRGSRRRRTRRATWRASAPTRWGHAGWAPTRRRRWPTAAGSSTTRAASGSAMGRRSRPRLG